MWHTWHLLGEKHPSFHCVLVLEEVDQLFIFAQRLTSDQVLEWVQYHQPNSLAESAHLAEATQLVEDHMSFMHPWMWLLFRHTVDRKDLLHTPLGEAVPHDGDQARAIGEMVSGQGPISSIQAPSHENTLGNAFDKVMEINSWNAQAGVVLTFPYFTVFNEHLYWVRVTKTGESMTQLLVSKCCREMHYSHSSQMSKAVKQMVVADFLSRLGGIGSQAGWLHRLCQVVICHTGFSMSLKHESDV